MRITFSLIISFVVCTNSYSQLWEGSNISTTTSDYSTFLQLTHDAWGSHHGILFNAYKNPVSVDGNLMDAGNVKQKFGAGQNGSGAGAIMFLGNGGRMDFLITDPSNGAGQDISWGTPKLTINRNGNVGIGNVNPQGLIHATGLGQNAWIYFANNINNGGNPQNIHGLQFGWNKSGGAGESLIVYNTSLGGYPRLTFNSFNGTTFVEEMTLVGGKLGIGTTSPGSYKLAVEGKIGAREVNVTTASWADYVFDDAYKLPSLQELEAYIKLNNHLPDVPTEAEVKANGVNLGEMNVLLLKQVEELTLYVIEQNKKIQQIDSLKAELFELKARLK
jgi:hypothetical protein